MEKNKIYNEECISGLARMPFKVDCIVTDPPFAFAGGISNGGSSTADDQFFYHWLRDLFKELVRVSNEGSCWFVYGDWRTMYLYDRVLKEIQSKQSYSTFKVSQVLVHDREMIGMGKPFRNQIEYIAYIKNQKTDITRIPSNQPNIIRSYWYYGKHEFHPAEKDANVIQKFVEWGCDENGLVLDPFMGSGTTAVACLNSNRNYIGFEIDEGFYETALKRVENSQLQTSLFPYGFEKTDARGQKNV